MISDYLKKGGTISKLPPALAKGMKPSEMKPHKIGDKGVIKSIDNRGWDIRNATDWKKFEAGMI